MTSIVYFIPNLFNSGGMERILTHKVNYLVSTGKYDITILLLQQNGLPPFFELDTSVKVVDLNISHDLPPTISWLKRQWFKKKLIMNYKRKVNEYLGKYPADICISMCGQELDFFSSLQNTRIKIAEYHMVKDPLNKGLLSKWKGHYQVWKNLKQLSKLDQFVVLTRLEQQNWSKKILNVIQIYNSTDKEVRAGTIPWQKKMISVGRLIRGKGFHDLIRIWSIVVQKHPDWILDIWGEGPCRTELERLIIELNLTDSVFLRGVTLDIRSEYLTSYAYVMSSHNEAFPMVLLESMACRLPIISFDCDYGPKEMIQHGKNGYLVSQGNNEKFADSINFLIEYPAIREQMASQSLQDSKQYETEYIMSQWIGQFDKLLKK